MVLHVRVTVIFEMELLVSKEVHFLKSDQRAFNNLILCKFMVAP